MVESEASGLTEEEMLNAVKFGHEGFVPVIEMIEELAKECRKPEWTVEKKDLSEVKKKLEETFTEDLKKAFATRDKPDVSDSTISTASFVPATTKSKLDFSNSSFDGLRIYLPST